MADIGLVGQREQIGEAALPGQRRHSERRYELLTGLGQDGARGDTAILQPPDQLQAFIGGNAAADDQQDGAGG